MRYDRGYDRSARRAWRGSPRRYGWAAPGRARWSGMAGESGPGSRYDRDYWWLGEHELRRRSGYGPYDDVYRRFSDEHHPRYTPVGGMYHGVGGSYVSHPPPRPIREPMWFSDWTRWF